ncbi:hypothetical protein WKR88_25975 [Trinickia caryophylli]|uniref:Uncharacterized protein n=1 Tax=Trinickia caryophylli TaxID=28094 RepID=A0A1X7GC33_TRICW|nr:hypothetical protein [Trinickia caryophylli]PMS11343.1 hypothetical protein C0Z17_14430 [Trinickia caryophylli]TRX17535.1 hypothetical protein FNF07_04345 [Trinickia caryophylli]WQE11716.1 hypothetical protein U0034_18565 [Trinickia caryophylli]SMF66768.1 hypothetical protein SAMN06295900_114150 [Trinickia caryophylli]GLU34902.1 hypothetical protein Busp01_47440 [Trinickia caryophylli]
MDVRRQQDIATLLSPPTGPCLTLCQPVHGSFPESKQDVLRYRRLLARLGERACEQYGKNVAEPVIARFEALIDDRGFWDHTFKGLAVYGGPDVFHVVRLDAPVAERIVAADRFYLKPLIEQFQFADPFQLLLLSRHNAALYQGDVRGLAPVDLHPTIPRSAVDTAATAPESEDRAQAVKGGENRGDRSTSHHGGGSKHDVVNEDEERFFRMVARGVCEHHSQPTKMPLLLAATPEHQALFRRISSNPYLLEERIDAYLGDAKPDELAAAAARALSEHFRKPVEARLNEYREAYPKALATDVAAEAIEAAHEGRVGALLVESDQQANGQTESEAQLAAPTSRGHREVDTLLDDVAQEVLRTGGEVIVLPAERMPSHTGLAAIYRYRGGPTQSASAPR